MFVTAWHNLQSWVCWEEFLTISSILKAQLWENTVCFLSSVFDINISIETFHELKKKKEKSKILIIFCEPWFPWKNSSMTTLKEKKNVCRLIPITQVKDCTYQSKLYWVSHTNAKHGSFQLGALCSRGDAAHAEPTESFLSTYRKSTLPYSVNPAIRLDLV